MVPGGNAGVFVWADDITSRGVPFHRGIEVQVLENAYGNTRGSHHSRRHLPHPWCDDDTGQRTWRKSCLPD